MMSIFKNRKRAKSHHPTVLQRSPSKLTRLNCADIFYCSSADFFGIYQVLKSTDFLKKKLGKTVYKIGLLEKHKLHIHNVSKFNS